MDISGKAKRAAAVGVVTGVATQLIYGNTGQANLLGTYVSSPVGVGASAAAGSLAAGFIHDYVPSATLGGLGASALELAGAGLVTSAAMTAMDLDTGISVQGVVMGAGSLLAGRGLLNAVGESNVFW
jgi:hypothetical protein